MRVSDGKWIPVPDAPAIAKVVKRDGKGRIVEEGGPASAEIVADWLAFSYAELPR